MTEKSAVAEHAWENHHPINWEETSVLDRARGQGGLLLKEALYMSANFSELELVLENSISIYAGAN